LNKKKDLKERKRKQRIVKSWAKLGNGHAVAIIGCGPSVNSLTAAQRTAIEQIYCIGINAAHKAIKCDMILFQDFEYARNHKDYIIDNPDDVIFMCRDICCMIECEKMYNYRLEPGKWSKSPIGHPEILCGSGCSGITAVSLAVNLGFNPIILIGMDGKYDEDGNTSFFGKNHLHTNQTLKNFNLGLSFVKREYSKDVKFYSLSDNDYFKRKNFNKVIKKIGIGKKIKLI